MLFAFARDEVAVPRSLASVNRAGTPARALVWLGGADLVVSLAAGWGLGPLNGFLVLVTTSSVALFAGHILANFALPAFFRRIRAFRPFFHVVAPLVASVLVGFGIWYTVYPPLPGRDRPITVAAGIVVGVVPAWRLSPAALARAGRAATAAERETRSGETDRSTGP